MHGVILWSDPQTRKAVIWCEDHGALAHVDDPAGEGVFCPAGVIVRFAVHTTGGVRFATDVRIVAHGVYSDLPQILRAARPDHAGPRQTSPTFLQVVDTAKTGAGQQSPDRRPAPVPDLGTKRRRTG